MCSTKQIMSFLQFSDKTLQNAGTILLKHKQTFLIQKTKDSLALDIATDADYEVENSIIKAINDTYPNHSILTEETNNLEKKSDFEWIIDPLDGTKEYVRHCPYYYSLLALEYKGELICGAGYQPEIKRMFKGGKKIGAYLNDSKVSLSTTDSLGRSFISIGLPVNKMSRLLLQPYLSLITKFTASCYRLRNTPWDVEALFNVSMGIVDGFIIPPHEPGRGPKWWDIASGIAVLLANGGTITDFKGNPYHARSNEYGLVASNGKIHKELLDCIRTSYK